MVAQKIKIGKKSEFENGKAKALEIGGKKIGVAYAERNFWAFDDVCTHDGGTLAVGDVIDTEIECPRHGAHFDLKTGKALTLPAVRGITVYAVTVEGDDVYIEI